jgi:hypothetical protein
MLSITSGAVIDLFFVRYANIDERFVTTDDNMHAHIVGWSFPLSESRERREMDIRHISMAD